MDEAKREKKRAQGRAHYEANKEAYKAKNKAWREANSERYKELTVAYNAANKDRTREASARWYRENKARAAATSRRLKLRSYGITETQYQAMLAAQGYACPICEKFFAAGTKPAVDHSHTTGAVRGILCRKCNTAIGLMEDSVGMLERAIDYLSMERLRRLRKVLSGASSTTSSARSNAPLTLPA